MLLSKSLRRIALLTGLAALTACTVEPLRAANTLAGQNLYAWQFYSPDGAPVESSSGLQVAPHGAIGAGVVDRRIIVTQNHPRPARCTLEHIRIRYVDELSELPAGLSQPVDAAGLGGCNQHECRAATGP